MDFEGNKIVDEEFNEVEFLPNNVICLQRKKDNLWNNMDYDGFFLHEWTKYMSFELWSNGLRIGRYSNCYHQDLYDIIDANNNVISGGFSSIGKLIDGKAKVSLDAFSGEVDESGKILPEQSFLFSNGYQAVKKLGYWELLNNLGNRILGLSERIEFVKQLDDSIFVIQKKGLEGLADRTGIILPCEYNSIQLWSPGILHIIQSNVQFLTDRTGKHRISQCYGKIDKLENGIARVSIGPLIGYINDKGLQIPEHEIVLEDGSIKYMFMGKWRIRSAEGEQLLKRHYAEIASYEGFYYGIDSGKIEITECKTTNTVYFQSVKCGEDRNSFLFKTDGVVVHVLKSKVKSIWKEQIPDSANLIISNINNRSKKVYAVPFIHSLFLNRTK